MNESIHSAMHFFKQLGLDCVIWEIGENEALLSVGVKQQKFQGDLSSVAPTLWSMSSL